MMSQLDRDQRLSDLQVLRAEWKEQSIEAALDEVPEVIQTDHEKQNHLQRVVEYRSQHIKILKEG